MATIREFYAFLIQYRLDEGNILLRCGRLFLQFIVDCYATIEAWRLLYIKNHQRLRVELCSGLQDANTAGENDVHVVEKMLMLPASFTGGPHYMRQHFLDAMTVCNQMAIQIFLITFTCNPNWPKIQEALAQQRGQYVNYRLDIVARVFRLRLKDLKRDFK